jgi:hypothetical protein
MRAWRPRRPLNTSLVLEASDDQPGVSLKRTEPIRQKEAIMHKCLSRTSAAIAILYTVTLAPISVQAGSMKIDAPTKSSKVFHGRLGHRTLPYPSFSRGEITSFSSSSQLAHGVNHPAKK